MMVVVQTQDGEAPQGTLTLRANCGEFHGKVCEGCRVTFVGAFGYIVCCLRTRTVRFCVPRQGGRAMRGQWVEMDMATGELVGVIPAGSAQWRRWLATWPWRLRLQRAWDEERALARDGYYTAPAVEAPTR